MTSLCNFFLSLSHTNVLSTSVSSKLYRPENYFLITFIITDPPPIVIIFTNDLEWTQKTVFHNCDGRLHKYNQVRVPTFAWTLFSEDIFSSSDMTEKLSHYTLIPFDNFYPYCFSSQGRMKQREENYFPGLLWTDFFFLIFHMFSMTGKLVIYFPGFPGHVGFIPNLQMTLTLKSASTSKFFNCIDFNWIRNPEKLKSSQSHSTTNPKFQLKVFSTCKRVWNAGKKNSTSQMELKKGQFLWDHSLIHAYFVSTAFHTQTHRCFNSERCG